MVIVAPDLKLVFVVISAFILTGCEDKAGLEKELADLQRERKALSLKRQEQDAQRATLEQAVRDLQRQNHKSETESFGLDAELEELQSQLQQAQAEFGVASKAASDARKRLDQYRTTNPQP